MYTTIKALSTTRQVELVGKKKFATATFDLDDKTFVIHIISITSSNSVHLSHRAQMALLKANEASSAMLSKYADFIDVFFLDLVTELLEYTKINNNVIMMVDDK